ncbi:hypothetical protein [Chryseobacterium sp.]|uniref:hypothetical protein n=1 Tax=Chryseobacterium sp. TaxID=1871047 RepID=UPI00289C49E3|nr:hypothetical protein [Chryseobacterium sp.]
MKNICFILFLLIISLNISCLSSKKSIVLNCENENLFYKNYIIVKELNKLKNIPEVKKINEDWLREYLCEGANFEEIEKNKIIFIPKNDFFEDSNLTGEIPLYVLGYFQNKKIKQYLVSELHLGENSSLYLINQINDKIVSVFLVYENYRDGFSARNITSKRISDSIYEMQFYLISDKADLNGNFSKRCSFHLKLSDDGSVTPHSNVNHTE